MGLALLTLELFDFLSTMGAPEVKEVQQEEEKRLCFLYDYYTGDNWWRERARRPPSFLPPPPTHTHTKFRKWRNTTFFCFSSSILPHTHSHTHTENNLFGSTFCRLNIGAELLFNVCQDETSWCVLFCSKIQRERKKKKKLHRIGGRGGGEGRQSFVSFSFSFFWTLRTWRRFKPTIKH